MIIDCTESSHAGSLLPGSPFANIIFKMYSVQTLTEATICECKLEYYIKLFNIDDPGIPAQTDSWAYSSPSAPLMPTAHTMHAGVRSEDGEHDCQSIRICSTRTHHNLPAFGRYIVF